MKGSLAVALVIAVVLAGGTVNLSAASTGNTATGPVAAAPGRSDAAAAPQKPDSTTPQSSASQDGAQMDAMMQKIETVCADPSSPACAAALSQIEPCGAPKAPAMADAGHPQSTPACSAN